MRNKLLLLCASIFVAQGLYAKDITCYKNNWSQPSTIETTALDGDICNAEFSLKQMQKKGWFIKDIVIKPAKDGLNYSYVLTDKNPVSITKKQIEKNISEKTKVSFNNSDILISNVTDETATINIGNLKAGQSGIIEHKYDNGRTIIISSAFVEKSDTKTSTIKFIPFLGLKQNAIPTTNRKVQNNNRFMLNYLYDESLLISPNPEAFRAIRKKFTKNNFAHADLFGTYLKVNYQPNPSKELIQEYALSQNMGTIFFVIDSSVYIVDTRTFVILDKQPISYLPGDEQLPFYTRVEKIESSILDQEWFSFSFIQDLFGEDTRTEDEKLYGDLATQNSKNNKSSYTAYYKNLLGV